MIDISAAASADVIITTRSLGLMTKHGPSLSSVAY